MTSHILYWNDFSHKILRIYFILKNILFLKISISRSFKILHMYLKVQVWERTYTHLCICIQGTLPFWKWDRPIHTDSKEAEDIHYYNTSAQLNAELSCYSRTTLLLSLAKEHTDRKKGIWKPFLTTVQRWNQKYTRDCGWRKTTVDNQLQMFGAHLEKKSVDYSAQLALYKVRKQ